MAQENILSISLRDYKKEIEELKGSLLGLDKDSEEYAKTVQEIKDRQQKLNEVMSDTSSKGAVAANTMAELKQQLKEMLKELNNTEIGTERFNELQKSILETNNKLKELEEEHGTFSRNVGNYSNSIIDAFGQMGLNVSNLKGAFSIATQAGDGFRKMLTLIQKHPIIAIITVIVGILMKVADAIKQNEQASRSMQRAMSALQPIIDLFNRILGVMAEALAAAAEWLAVRLPGALKTVGGWIGKGIDFVGWYIKTWVKFSTVVPKVVLTAFNAIVQGAQWVIDKLASLVEYIDSDAANAMRNATKGIQNFVDGASKGIDNIANSVTGWIDKTSNAVKGFLNGAIDSYSKKQKEIYTNTVKQQQLEDNIRQQQELSAQSELKQAQLRDKIATASGQERIRLLKELRQEIETNGKREVAIAKESLRLAEFRAAQAPNSREDNERLATLRANVIKAEAAYQASFAKVDKMTQATEDKMTAAAKKAAVEAIKAEEKKQKEYETAFNTRLKLIADEEKANLESITASEKLTQSLGGLTFAKQTEYENMRFEVVQQTNAKVNAAYEEAIKSTEISEAQRAKIIATYSNEIIRQKTEELEHTAALNKIKLAEINDDTAKAIQQANDLIAGNDLVNTYTELFSRLDKEDQVSFVDKLNVTPEQKEQILANLTQLHQDEMNATSTYYTKAEEAEHAHQQKLLDIEKQRIQAMKDAGFGLEEIQAAEDEYQKHRLEEEIRTNKVMAKLREQDTKDAKKKMEQQIKTYTDLAKGIGSLMGSISDIMKNNLDEKVKNGKISEEEAKKEFERIKAIQIAETTINTIAGAAGAFLQAVKTYPSPWGAILGGIEAATATATGIAQIQQIKAQQYGSTTTPSGVQSTVAAGPDMNTLAVNPLLDENRDILSIGNATNLDNKVYILQTDIIDSNNQVEIRENESTF